MPQGIKDYCRLIVNTVKIGIEILQFVWVNGTEVYIEVDPEIIFDTSFDYIGKEFKVDRFD